MAKIQVLVATMHQSDHSLLVKMNIQSDAIIGNQCDRDSIEHFEWNGHNITYLNFAERGVGLNRNNTLFRANEDICLFSDDDVVYIDGYEKIISDYYEKNATADVVIFNMKVSREGISVRENIVTRNGRINRLQATSFGTVCVSAKTSSLRWANICFHREFGGGARYSCGEDTIFLQDCFKRGLSVHTCSSKIGSVYNGASTWFNGYTVKYFNDKGLLFKQLYPHCNMLVAFYNCFKHRKLYEEFGWLKALRVMKHAKRI